MNLAPKKVVVNGERGIQNFEYVHRIVHLSPRSILEHFYYLKKTTLPAKVRLVKAMVFPVAMYGCESWTIKESRAPKNWCFWTVVLEKTLESPLNCKEILKEIHQSILKEISPEYSLEGLMLKLKLWSLATWCEDLTHWKRPWCWERLKAGGEGDDRGWDGWMASPTQWTWVWTSSRSWWWTGKPGVLHYMGS